MIIPIQEYDVGVMAFATGDTIGCESAIKLYVHLYKDEGRIYWLIRDRYGGSCYADRVVVDDISYKASIWSAETIVNRAMSATPYEVNKLMI